MHNWKFMVNILIATNVYTTCVLILTHCTITCFVFCAKQIYGVSVVYFRFTHILGRSCYARDVYLYLCTEVYVNAL